MMRQTTALFVLGLALSLSACGGAVAPSQAPPSASDGLPSSTHAGAEASYANVDEAEQGLRRAEAELRSALGASPAAAGAPPKAEPRSPEPPAGPQPGTPPAREAQPQDASSCATACRAFTSMTKAADTICRLAGNADERCTRAQRSLEDARSSLRTCVCVTAP